ncbi:MAG TPA: ABC transporter ATP-binding protein [Caulobacter sp.]|nr:ABC transporter ATP-binding protein [Caulobacter sp.]
MSAPPELSSRALMARVWREYLRPQWPGLVVALVCAALIAAVNTKLLQMIRPAIDDLVTARNPSLLWIIPGTIIALALARTLLQVLQSTLINRIGNGVVGAVQVQLFGRLIRADLARLKTTHTGSYVASMLYDAGLIREASTSGVVNYARETLIVLGALVTMGRNDLWLTVGVITVAPLASLLMRRFSKRSRKATRGAMGETSALATAIMEALDGIRIVKMENREDYEEARVAEVVKRRQRHLIKGSNARSRAAPVTELMSMVVVAAVFLYAGWRAQHGGISAGSLTEFILALMMAAQSLRQLANLQTIFTEGSTAARRLFSAMDVEPEVVELDSPRPLPARTEGHVRLDGVAFAYAGGPPVLENVTLEARKGEMVALVGPSGGGKSTVLSLIPRFYDVTEGSVTLDGVDVREAEIARLRERIALVTQEPFLFDDTIRANIAYARPDASDAQIEEAARRAAAHDFIVAFPEGYDTVVGEAASRLSGGQRQRIAIARAFLKDAPILLLDEATSALDTESEAQVQAALDRLMTGRTTIVIAHRLSTVKGADRIYVIDRGRVVEQGPHGALIRKRGGLYARLAKAQDLETVPAGAS